MLDNPPLEKIDGQWMAVFRHTEFENADSLRYLANLIDERNTEEKERAERRGVNSMFSLQ